MSQTETGPILVAKGLRKHYPVKTGMFGETKMLKAVDGMSFDLSPRQTLAVVGESGCGKSTLGRMLTLIELPTEGSLTLDGRDATQKKAIADLRTMVQIIFQDPYSSLNPRKTIGTTLEEPVLINTKHSKSERQEMAREMMARVGLRTDQYGRYPHMFSGGQRQRVAIARALMLRPRIIVADEPVSALDVSVQAQVLNLLRELQEEFGQAYVFVSHDLSVVRHVADDVIVMYLGRAVEHGKREDVLDRPRHPYTRALIASTPSIDPTRRRQRQLVHGELPSPLRPPSGCAFHQRCPFATDRCSAETPELRVVDSRQVACHHAEDLPDEAPPAAAA